jgi:hypothetical protein
MERANTMTELQTGAVEGTAPACERCGGTSVLYVVDHSGDQIFTCLTDHGTVVYMLTTGVWPDSAPAAPAVIGGGSDDDVHRLRERLPAAPANTARARLAHTIAIFDEFSGGPRRADDVMVLQATGVGVYPPQPVTGDVTGLTMGDLRQLAVTVNAQAWQLNHIHQILAGLVGVVAYADSQAGGGTHA